MIPAWRYPVPAALATIDEVRIGGVVLRFPPDAPPGGEVLIERRGGGHSHGRDLVAIDAADAETMRRAIEEVLGQWLVARGLLPAGSASHPIEAARDRADETRGGPGPPALRLG